VVPRQPPANSLKAGRDYHYYRKYLTDQQDPAVAQL